MQQAEFAAELADMSARVVTAQIDSTPQLPLSQRSRAQRQLEWATALQENIIAIGGQYNDNNGLDSGHVKVFENIAGTWTQIGSTIEGENVGDEFGSSVSLSSDGSILSIGAMRNDGNGTDSGHERYRPAGLIIPGKH